MWRYLIIIDNIYIHDKLRNDHLLNAVNFCYNIKAASMTKLVRLPNVERADAWLAERLASHLAWLSIRLTAKGHRG